MLIKIDKIHAGRESAIDSILAICTAYLARYSASTVECKRVVGKLHNQACNTLMYGALMKCLSSASLSPAHFPAAKALSVKTVVGRLHNLTSTIFGFVQDAPCPPANLTTTPSLFGSLPPRLRCKTHGEREMCPGTTFHVGCSFLPPMLKEVNAVVENVQGLKIAEFESRKVSGAVV